MKVISQIAALLTQLVALVKELLTIKQVKEDNQRIDEAFDAKDEQAIRDTFNNRVRPSGETDKL